MQAILLEDVDGLGEAGSVVAVARGYMRNYLLPRGLAQEATPGRIAQVRRLEQERREAEERMAAQAREFGDTLGRTVLTLQAKAGADGRLFGSITSQDVADAIADARDVRLARSQITIDPPIRALGTYAVPVRLSPEVTVEVKTIVSPLVDDA